MKTPLLISAMLTASLLCYSQKEKSGIIKKNDYGKIVSVEFPSIVGEVAPTDGDFFREYLETGEHDRFEKISDKSSRQTFFTPKTVQFQQNVPFCYRSNSYRL